MPTKAGSSWGTRSRRLSEACTWSAWVNRRCTRVFRSRQAGCSFYRWAAGEAIEEISIAEDKALSLEELEEIAGGFDIDPGILEPAERNKLDDLTEAYENAFRTAQMLRSYSDATYETYNVLVAYKKMLQQKYATSEQRQ